MSIYTKTGDTGFTSLIGGTRVTKNDPRVEAYGSVDELNAHIGVVRSYITDNYTLSVLHRIQEELMTISAHLANDGSCKTLPPLKQTSEVLLEESIDLMQEQLPPLKLFLLPGPPIAAAHCQVARTVCRRAERTVVALDTDAVLSQIISFLNRLSDYLFVLSRFFTFQNQALELFYDPCK